LFALLTPQWYQRPLLVPPGLPPGVGVLPTPAPVDAPVCAPPLPLPAVELDVPVADVSVPPFAFALLRLSARSLPIARFAEPGLLRLASALVLPAPASELVMPVPLPVAAS
jgi:hypothetical protein